MIQLFNFPKFNLKSGSFSHTLHSQEVTELERRISKLVGVKYALAVNSATSAIFLSLLNKNITVEVPSILPPVVVNAIKTSNNNFKYRDDIEWVGKSYILHAFKDYKIIDSAHEIFCNQFKLQANDQDLIIYSFYPTKPLGGIDGGMIVSNDKEKIDALRVLAYNGKKEDNLYSQFGYKFYMTSVQAAVILKQLQTLDKKYQRLDRVRSLYNSIFCLTNHSNHLYRINVCNRNHVIKIAKKNKIQIGIHYKALHTDSFYSNNQTDLPKSSKESNTTLSIPFHEKLTRQQQLTIGRIFSEFQI